MTQPIGSRAPLPPASTTASRAASPRSDAPATRRSGADAGDHGATGTHGGFRDRLEALGRAARAGDERKSGGIGVRTTTGDAATSALAGHGKRGAERTVARDDDPGTRGRRVAPGASAADARELGLAPPELVPFRIGPAILAPPIARAMAEPPPALDPALFSAELVESLRFGRFGRDGHAMTMRVRGARSAIDVDVRTEGGRVSLRLSGDDDAEIARVRARVCADLAARGIPIDDDDA